MNVNKIKRLEETTCEVFKSSNFDAFLLDASGNVILSKLRKEGEEIDENALMLLENCKCISNCFKEGEVEDFILHGKKGYIIAVPLQSLILAVSGVQESEIEETIKEVKRVAKIIEGLDLNE
ncbi:MAG: roadblock/LC7 domain-containing protein [Candidatus Jordarchaeaceae archaeon]